MPQLNENIGFRIGVDADAQLGPRGSDFVIPDIYQEFKDHRIWGLFVTGEGHKKAPIKMDRGNGRTEHQSASKEADLWSWDEMCQHWEPGRYVSLSIPRFEAVSGVGLILKDLDEYKSDYDAGSGQALLDAADELGTFVGLSASGKGKHIHYFTREPLLMGRVAGGKAAGIDTLRTFVVMSGVALRNRPVQEIFLDEEDRRLFQEAASQYNPLGLAKPLMVEDGTMSPVMAANIQLNIEAELRALGFRESGDVKVRWQSPMSDTTAGGMLVASKSGPYDIIVTYNQTGLEWMSQAKSGMVADAAHMWMHRAQLEGRAKSSKDALRLLAAEMEAVTEDGELLGKSVHEFNEEVQAAEMARLILDPNPVDLTKYPEPEPLVTPLQAEFGDFPIEALGPLQPVALAIAGKVQVPVEIAAQSALSVLSQAAQARYDVKPHFRGPVPLSLYQLTVAESSDRKSTADKEAEKGIKSYEKKLLEQYKKQKPQYDAQYAVWKDTESALRSAIKAAVKKEAEGKPNDVDIDDLTAQHEAIVLQEPRPPKAPVLTLENATTQALEEYYKVAHPSLGIRSAEGAMFLSGYSMGKSETRDAAMGAFNKLHDGDGMNSATVGRGFTSLPNRRLAMHLLLQPNIVDKILKDQDAIGIGFVARYLVSWPKSIRGTRLSANQKEDLTGEIDKFAQRIEELLSEAQGAPDGGVKTSILAGALGSEVEAIAKDFQDMVERAMVAGGPLEDVARFGGKAAETAYRVAGCLTAYMGGTEISSKTMRDACALLHYYIHQQQLIFAKPTEQEKTVQKSLNWMMCPIRRDKRQASDKYAEHWDVFRAADLVQAGLGGIKNTTDAKEVMQRLIDAGWVLQLPAGASIRGHKVTEKSLTCRVNPAAWGRI